MRFSRIAAAAALGVMIMSQAAQGAEFVVFSTISAKEALIELVPEFEHASGHKVNITYAGGSGLAEQIRKGTRGDLFIGPEEFSDPLLKEGKLQAGSRTAFARSTTGLAVRAGAAKPDISSPDKLKSVLLAARTVSYSTGASGMHFVKLIERLGIAEAVAAKKVAPKPGELVGAVVARGDAEIGAQQISELLPVKGIQILDPLPAELQQTIVYGATAFPGSTQPEAAKAFVNFLRSEPARKVLREKGLDPA
ncbi:MAG TPA: molybdate ABC transporter substrate-binding protein [Burkholderiales bacterium]|nr:molybdate ABC transporter substrate-binding protein [Burkholderiales bacterium]